MRKRRSTTTAARRQQALALGLALIQSTVPILGARWRDPALMNVARSTALAQLLFVESIQLSRELGDRRGLCSTLCYLGQVLLQKAEHEAAQHHFLEGLALSREVNSIRGIAAALEGLALLAQAQARPLRAARLLGAADALRNSQHAPRVRLWQPAYDQLQAYLRSELGEARALACLGQGQRMSLQQAVQYARELTAE